MPTDTDTTEAHDAEETTPIATPAAGRRRSVARIVRRLVTPVSIVIAWMVVVSQWNGSDTELFNWATTTAGIVLAIVTILWLVSLRFPALRRALLPFEGGLVVGAVVLAWATGGREVDLLGDRIAVAAAFGVIAALLLAFMQQLVAGRDRAGAWLAGVVVLCAAAGIAVPATLDWLDGSEESLFVPDVAGELVGRSTADGFRLDDVSMFYDAPTLGSGYVDSDMAMYGIGVGSAEPAIAIDPSSEAPVVIGDSSPAAIATPAPYPTAGVSAGAVPAIPTVRNDWAQLLARPDGSIRLVVQRAIATGVDGAVQGSLRRGGCGDATDAREVLSFGLGRGDGDQVERTLPTKVRDLRVGDRMSLVVGVAEPLAPTRCVQLLSPSGVALAQLGAASFHEECLEPLELPRGNEYLVRPSSFQDAGCAERFEEYAGISGALLVEREHVAKFRRCQRANERGAETSERKLAHGAIAVTYRDPMRVACHMYGIGSMSSGGYSVGPAALPAPGVVGEPTYGSGVAPAAGVAPTGVAPAAPTPIDPATGMPTSEDLDGLTQEELAAKIR